MSNTYVRYLGNTTLGLPRIDVDGRFGRAERLAATVGTVRQRLRVAYLKAWTAFWWYDDYESFNTLYDSVESLAQDSLEAPDVEQLTNLWLLLAPSVRSGHIKREGSRLDERTTVLKSALTKIAADQGRPSNALWARTCLLNVDVFLSYGDPLKVSRLLQEMKAVLAEGQQLQNYPLESLAEIIIVLAGC